MHNIPDTLHDILQKLGAVNPQRDGSWIARCPAHDDREPSLHISLSGEHILLHCFAGCRVEDICSALGITPADLFLRNGHHEPESSPEGLTLEAFAQAKGLQADRLQQWHVRQGEYQGKPAVTFAYLDMDGDLQAVRVRTALAGNRFRWRNGARPKELLYGAWWLPGLGKRGITRILLVEGESDCLTLWQAGIPAVGVAGADCLSEQNASLLDGFEIFLWLEPDSGGRKLLQSAVDHFGDRLKVIQPPTGIKDANDLWLSILRQEQDWHTAREQFKREIDSLMKSARELSEVSEPIYMPTVPTLRESAPNLVDLGTLPEPPPQEWLVKDLIPARFITNLYADSGQGKSFLILHLALCCLTATSFCGKPVKGGKVLYLDWELDCDTTARRWYAVCRGAGFATALRGLLYGRMTKPLSAVFPYIHSLVQEHSPVLVVIDSMGKALGVDPRDPEKAIQAYNLLEQLPCAVLVIDHQGKLQTEDTYANKTEYGTAYKAHYARSRLQIERIGEASASTKANDTDTSADGQLSDTDTSAVSRVGIVIRHKKSNFGALQPDLHLVMTFTNDEEGNLHAVRFEHVQAADTEADALGARGEILRLLREADRTVEELEELIGLSRSTIAEHLNALRRAGLVEEKGRRGKAKLWGTVGNVDYTSDTSDTSSDTSSQTPSADSRTVGTVGGIYIADTSDTSMKLPANPHEPLLLEWEVTPDDGS